MNKIRALVREYIKKSLEEISTSAAAGPYDTPNAFTAMTRKGEEKREDIALMARGYSMAGKDDTASSVNESAHPLVRLIHLIKEEQESAASLEAKKHNLQPRPFGRYADATGKIVARSVGGNLEWLKGASPKAPTPEQPKPEAPKPAAKSSPKPEVPKPEAPKKAAPEKKAAPAPKAKPAPKEKPAPKKPVTPKATKPTSNVTTIPNPNDPTKVFNVVGFKEGPDFNPEALDAYIKTAKPGSRAEDILMIDGLTDNKTEDQVLMQAMMPWIMNGWSVETMWDDKLEYERNAGSQHGAGQTPYMYGRSGRSFGGGHRLFFQKNR